ncbi:EAL domain-containing protein [Shewanella maritima]|uniref:EAL domain-containing protein n=1 Tax=Shewanella maritima TaxID=2520507 RepID=A0A411PKQ4_9GAMM|nr:EAL domain-containing protein [Shewanella maritima]QBF84098.1 EAL domain-containing protein [Shewanella maritima]
MPRFLLGCFLLFSVLLSTFSYADFSIDSSTSQFDIQLNYDSYSVADGLSQNTVSSFVEDSEGYIWVGTINGLNRFDGNEFKQFHANKDHPHLASSFIRQLLIDSQGRMLVGTDRGLSIFNQHTETFHNSSQHMLIGERAIWSLDEQDGELLLGFNNEVLILNSGDHHLLNKFTSNDFKEVKKIIKLNGGYYIRNYDGIVFRVENNTIKRVIDNTNDITKLNDQLLITSQRGTFTLTQSNDLTKISNQEFETFDNRTNKGINFDFVIATNHRSVFKINRNYEVNKIGSTNANIERTTALYINEKNNSIIIANYDEGFVFISKTNNLVKNVAPQLTNIWSVVSNDNTLYIGTSDESIHTLDENLNIKDSIVFKGVIGPKFLAFDNSDLYVGGKQGLYVKSENGEISRLTDKHITHLKAFKNTIIAGTFSGKILEFENKNLVREFNSKQQYPIFDTLISSSKTWVASQKGLHSIDRKSGEVRTIFDEDIATSLKLDNNKLYFGTRTSLLSVNIEKPERISEVFSNDKVIYSIDQYNTFLLTSSAYEINVISAIKNSHIRLGKNNGALGDYAVSSSLSIGENILFGGTEGLSLINTNEISSELNKKVNIKTNLKELLLFNSPVKIDGTILSSTLNHQDRIKLKYSDYPFSIKFNAVGRASNTVDFRYKLLGLDQEWIAAQGVNSATYTNLSPGDYIFTIEAVDKVSGHYGPERRLAITITPPWWLTVQAKLVYALIVLIIASLISRAVMKRRQIQRQVALSEERLKLSLWGSGDEMWDWDIESGHIYRSNIWGTLDFPRDGRRSGTEGEQSNIHPHDQHRVQKALNDHFSGLTDHFEITYRVKGRDNQWNWILDRAKIVERDQKERPVRMTGTIKDINKIKQTEEQLRLFARAIENISEGMFILDENYFFVEVNDACCDISANSREKFEGIQLEFDRYPTQYSEQVRSLLKQQGRWAGEVEASRGDGEHFLMELTIDAIYNEQGDTSHYVGVFSDITRRKQQEEELRKLTNNDILTGLPNRSSLQVTLSNLVMKDVHHTLMVLDVDNFKRINDSLGHQIGDDLLIGIAERIKMSVPNVASLYRLGGDEFALLIDQTPDIGSCAAIASNIIQALNPAFEIGDESLVVGISIGIVLYPEDEQSEQALLRKADIAMYHAKSAGGNRYQFYSESLNQNALKQLETENLIREALKDDLFEVYYQPKVDVKNDCLAGMEALVRLKHPQKGLIPPNVFIPLAEENGLIVEIGDVVLRKACFAANKWLDEGVFSGRVAVNLSSRQFALPDLQQRIESILRLTKLPAKHLELEITEGTVIKNPENAIKVMLQLSKMGVSLALDDFGTGYSSLSYLKRFPINCLKIDKSFVDDIDKSDRDLKMVDSIITIAHNMGLSVVGEGVEQTAQLNILKALNCEEIQGYIYSKPIPEADFTLLLESDTQRKLQKVN